ncbi:MAG: tetratricopeptide repeat protein [Planctomycetota bacterium]
MSQRRKLTWIVGVLLFVGTSQGCSMLRLDSSRRLVPPMASQTPAATPINPLPKNKEADRRLAKTIDAEQAARACLVTAQTFKHQGLTGDAIAMFERARKHQPDLSGISRDLAVLYDRAGEYFKAEREYQAALAASPKDADLINDYGFFHYQRSQYDKAAVHFRDAIQLDSGHERAKTNLGMTLARQKRFDEAEAMFAEVSGPAAAAYNIAVLRAAEGDAGVAIAKCQQALSLQPTLEPAQRLVFQLSNSPPQFNVSNSQLVPNRPVSRGTTR